ncbi:MAG: hypothetical protein N2V78_11350 [Methanophagales archaeon]|nr:hypothetical protein [Methanophagales archaeon]
MKEIIEKGEDSFIEFKEEEVHSDDLASEMATSAGKRQATRERSYYGFIKQLVPFITMNYQFLKLLLMI